MINEFFSTNLWKYLLGAVLGTFLPSPTDPLHFYLQNWLYTHKLKRWKFELLEIFDWYLVDTLWYILLIVLAIILALSDISQVSSVTILLTALGAGASIGIVWRFLSKRRKKVN